MASWNELLSELESYESDDEKAQFLQDRQTRALEEISKLRSGTNVIFYASGWLQKSNASQMALQITPEDINAFMSVMYQMQWKSGLTLVLHTPGGITNAVETIVAYLTSKFPHMEVIVPTYAMSAGSMLSLASNGIIMGRQSQLGPIDPQMPVSNRTISARAVVDQFQRARDDITNDPRLAHVWAPALQSLGPSLLQEAQDALAYGERMVANWLRARMFSGRKDPGQKARQVAKYFNRASTHKSHGRRIDRDEVRSKDISVEDLEDTQALQDEVLTAYHTGTIMFEKTPVAKLLVGSNGRRWYKNV